MILEGLYFEMWEKSLEIFFQKPKYEPMEIKKLTSDLCFSRFFFVKLSYGLLKHLLNGEFKKILVNQIL